MHIFLKERLVRKFKIFNGFAIIAIALSLSACKTTIEPSDEVNVRGDGFEVDYGEPDAEGICPPGQAKKGYC